MDKPFKVTSDIEVLPANIPVPGMGVLPVNAFVIKAKEPVLLDTGIGIDTGEFMKALKSVIDPRELKWIWLTHDDSDHTGSLRKVMEAAPDAVLVANSLAVMRMNAAWPVPMDRVIWLNPGDVVEAGDRKLTAVRPPLFDNPTTLGAYDSKSGAYFSADFCGALIPSAAQNADDVPEKALTFGMTNWASADCPWVHMVEPARFGVEVDRIRSLGAKMVLSGHLPPAKGRTDQLLDIIAKVPASTPFVTPDQSALEQIMAQMKGAA
jgi:Metallo-beta-lactamase superfamily